MINTYNINVFSFGEIIMATGYKGLRMSGNLKQHTMGNMRVQKGIDFIELAERGLITEPHTPTSTVGTGHKKSASGNPIGAAVTSTYVDMGNILNQVNIEYDYGEVTSATEVAETDKWALRRAVAASMAVSSSPAGSLADWTKTWEMTSNFATYVVEDTSARHDPALAGYSFQGGVDSLAAAEPLQWSDDGYMLYIQGVANKWIQHGVSTAWDASSIIDSAVATTTTSAATVAQETARLKFRVVDGGNKVISYRGYGTTQLVYMDELTTPGDLTSKVNTTTNTWAPQSMINYNGAYWSIDFMTPDGTKLYVMTSAGGFTFDTGSQMWNLSGSGITVIAFTLTTPWDLTSIVASNSVAFSHSHSIRNNAFNMLHFTPDGETMYTMTQNASYSLTLREFNLPTAWDVANASKNPVDVKLFGQNVDPKCATFSGDGKKIHVYDNGVVKTIDLEAEQNAG
jgi:hypothetical protein